MSEDWEIAFQRSRDKYNNSADDGSNLAKTLIAKTFKNDNPGDFMRNNFTIDYTYEDENGITPIIAGVMAGNLDVVKRAVNNGADLNSRFKGNSLLYLAERKGNNDIVTFLIKKGASASDYDNLMAMGSNIRNNPFFKNEKFGGRKRRTKRRTRRAKKRRNTRRRR